MGLYSDFQPYTNMHFISHFLHLFHGGRKTQFMQSSSLLQLSLLLSERLQLIGKSQIYTIKKENHNVILKN